MISKQEAAELIFAGVLGCLDKADQTKLNEYIIAGGDLPPQVGEFQNIAAMLPVILNPEAPDPQLKDKVARKLYRVKDEIRAKAADESLSAAEIFYKHSRSDKKLSTLDEKLAAAQPEKFKADYNKDESKAEEKSNVADSESEEEKVNEEKKAEVKPEEYEPVTPKRNTFESFKSTREKVLEGNFKEPPEEKKPVHEEESKPEPKIPTREKIQTNNNVITKEKTPYKPTTKESPYYRKASTKDRAKNFDRAYKKRYSTEEGSSGRKPVFNIWVIISLFTILFLMIAVIYLNFTSEIKDLNLTNKFLQQKLNDLSVKFSSTQEIQSLMESADVKVINFDGTGIDPGGKGKLIISFSQNKGYLQLSDMPALGQDRSYQLWMQLPTGNYFSLGVFNPTGRVQYFPFNIPQSVIGKVNDFIVTEESSSGASKPGNMVFLRGSLQ